MSTITIDDIQRDLPGFLRRIQAGEPLTIVQANKPVAKVTPLSPPPTMNGKRPFGLAKGEFTVPDDFNDPDPEIIELFGGL